MIFVAVGTTDFDNLITEMDHLAPTLEEKIVMQIGNGQYTPRNAEYFRFAPSLAPYYEQCDIIVAHGGWGIVSEALERGKKLICVENAEAHNAHQRDLLNALVKERYIVWCRTLEELSRALERIKHAELERYVSDECQIHIVIADFLQKSKKGK